MQIRLRELGTTGGSDSDESIFAEPPGRARAEDRGSLREVSYQARETPRERLQLKGVMAEALQICEKSKRLKKISKLSRHHRLV